MPCMCGDICCPSCGPAQGNWKCPICRQWASEGCEHVTEDGQIKPEFQAQVERIVQDQIITDDKLVAEMEEADAYWREH